MLVKIEKCVIFKNKYVKNLIMMQFSTYSQSQLLSLQFHLFSYQVALKIIKDFMKKTQLKLVEIKLKDIYA